MMRHRGWLRHCRRPKGRDSRSAPGPGSGRVDPVPWRHQHRRRSAGEQRSIRASAAPVHPSTVPAGRCRPSSCFFWPRRGVVFVRPAMDDDRHQPLIGDALASAVPACAGMTARASGTSKRSVRPSRPVQRGAGADRHRRRAARRRAGGRQRRHLLERVRQRLPRSRPHSWVEPPKTGLPASAAAVDSDRSASTKRRASAPIARRKARSASSRRTAAA